LAARGDLARRAVVALVVAGAALACVASSVVASTDLGGSLRADWEVSEASLLVLENLAMTVSLVGETWRTSGRTTLTDGVLSSFNVTDERTLGPLRLRSTCVFDPDDGFSYFGSSMRFALLDMRVGNYAFLSRDPSLSYDQVTARWTEGDVSLSGVWRVGLCPLEFRSGQVGGQWYVPGCDLFMDVRCAFTCTEGFDYLRVTGRLVRFPLLSNEVIETELRLKLQFEADRKSLTPSLRMRTRQVNACMTPHLELVVGASPIDVEGVEVYGWTVEFSAAEFIEMVLATSFDSARNRELTGKADYWEAWKLLGRAGGCCGRDLEWRLAVYFEEDAGSLFDWGLTTALVEIPLGEALKVRFGAEFSATLPHWILDVGLELRF
jgi:hypothetical protein